MKGRRRQVFPYETAAHEEHPDAALLRFD